MISPLPVYLTVPVLALEFVVTVLRFALTNETPMDRLINRTLIWGLVGIVLNIRDLAPDHASTMQQLSLGAILAILAGIYGVAKVWDGADAATLWQRQRRYDRTVAVVFVGVLLAGTPARNQGLLIDTALGLPAIVFWAVFGTPLAVCAVQVLRICLREFRDGDLTWREKLVFAAIIAAAVGLLGDAVAGPTVASLQTYTDLPFPDDPRMSRKSATFLLSAFACSIFTAIPLLPVLSTRLGWDRTSRHARRLRPLWHDLTAAFPGLVLYPAAELSRYPAPSRLHRMTVEIRDSLLGLRAYMPIETGARTDPDDPIARYAALVAHALEAKRAGARPDPNAARVAPRAPSTDNDLDSELEVLLALADHWPRAAAEARRAHGSAASTARTVEEPSR